MTPHLQEHLLQQVFRIRAGAEKPHGKGKDQRGVTIVKVSERLTIAPCNLLQKSARIVQSVSSHVHSCSTKFRLAPDFFIGATIHTIAPVVEGDDSYSDAALHA